MSKRTVRTHLAPTRRERRDPTAATQPLRFISPGYPQVDRWNAHTAVTRAYLANFVVARCIQIKAQDLAALPFLAGPRVPVDHTERPESNPNARLHRLLGMHPVPPNAREAIDGLASEVFWEWMLTQRYLTGKMAAEIEWSGRTFDSEIAALWPLPSAEVRPVATDGGARWFSEFHIGPPAGSRQKILKPGEIFYKWDPAPDDFRQPYSVLESAGIDVNVAIMVGRYNHAFLRNDARPAAVVVTEAFATDEDAEAFANQFEGRHQGVDNAGKIAFVETDPDGAMPGQAVRIETLGLSQKDARMLEMHRASLEHVSMALGVPWSRLSAADRTFSNAGQESVDYWKGLAGDARKIAGEVNASLAPLLGAEVGWFDLSGVEALAPRPPVEASSAAILVREGIATADEVRPWYGLSGPGPEMPALSAGGGDGGDGRGASRVAELPSGPGAGATLADDGRDVVAAQVAGRHAPALARSSATTRGAEPGELLSPDARVLTAEEQETRRTTIWKRNNATLVGLETAFAKRWAAYFNRQAAVVVDQITAKRTATRLTAASAARELRADLGIGGPMDPNEIARWRAQALDLADLMHNAATNVGVTRVNNAFGVSFDLEAPFIQDFIGARANQLAGQVTSSTYAAIQQALQDGVAAGEDINRIAARVQDVFAQASTNRAKTIARTEVISAANGSASLAASQLPSDVAAGQEFIATRDERTRDDHAEADGQIVAMGEPFIVGGESLLYPGDPAGSAENVINCRCTVAFLTPADFERAGRSRVVPLAVAKYALRTVRQGEFDAAEFRRSLAEVA